MTNTPQPATDFGAAKLQLRSDLSWSLQQCGGQPYYLLEDPVNARFYRMGVREWAIASRLDGKRPLREVVQLAAEELGEQALSEREIGSLCHWLTTAQLVQAETSSNQAPTILQVPAQNTLLRYVNPFFIKIPLLNPDRLLTAVLPWLGWMLTRPFFVLWTIVCLAGAGQVYRHWDAFWASTAGVLAPGNWLYLIAVWVLLKVVHELFHGLVCKKYGGNVPRAGVILILFSPLAFVDVTSAWRFRSKWQRIFTSVAGMYIEFFMAAVAALVWSHTDPGIVNHVCHNIVLMASLTTLLFNANALMRFDGYYVLADLLEIQNLYASGQQYVRYLSRRYALGVSATLPDWQGAKRKFIKFYGIATLIWRIVLYVSLGAVAATLFHGAGIILTAVALVLWIGLPTYRFVRYLINGTPQEQPNRLRFALVAAGATAAAALLFVLPWPGGVRAPAVVEYAPLTVVRVDSPGFVEGIKVRAGQFVEAGEILAVLSKPKTDADLADLQLAIRQSEMKARIHHNEGEMDKYLVEVKNRESLEEKRAELQRQVDKLTVRAPAAGHVIGRDLDSLTGQYVESGDSLMALGLEDQKELQLSVSQDSVESFQSQLGTFPRVRIPGRGETIRTGNLSRVNPRASVIPPHVALAATAGGPLPVTVAQVEDADEDQPANHRYELTSPRFTAIVDLPQDESQRLRAGELASVRLAKTDESIARHLYLRVSRWLRRKLRYSTSTAV